jgi:hypothetical protein
LPRWRFLNSRRLEESINGLEVDLRIEILASAMKVLEDPRNPDLFWFIKQTGDTRGSHVAELRRLVVYQPFEEIPPAAYRIKIVSLTNTPPA